MSTLSCAYSSPYCIQTERVWRHMSAGCTSNARAVRLGWVLDEYLDEEGLTYGRGPTGLITGCVRPWRASEHPLDKPVDAPACRKIFLAKAREAAAPCNGTGTCNGTGPV